MIGWSSKREYSQKYKWHENVTLKKEQDMKKYIKMLIIIMIPMTLIPMSPARRAAVAAGGIIPGAMVGALKYDDYRQKRDVEHTVRALAAIDEQERARSLADQGIFLEKKAQRDAMDLARRIDAEQAKYRDMETKEMMHDAEQIQYRDMETRKMMHDAEQRARKDAEQAKYRGEMDASLRRDKGGLPVRPQGVFGSSKPTPGSSREAAERLLAPYAAINSTFYVLDDFTTISNQELMKMGINIAERIKAEKRKFKNVAEELKRRGLIPHATVQKESELDVLLKTPVEQFKPSSTIKFLATPAPEATILPEEEVISVRRYPSRFDKKPEVQKRPDLSAADKRQAERDKRAAEREKAMMDRLPPMSSGRYF